MDDEGRSLSEVLTGRAQRPGLGPLERALQRNPRLMQLLDPVSAGDVAGWQAAQARGPYRPGNWLEQLQEEVRNLIPSVDKTTEQNLYAMNNIGAVGSARGVGAVPTPGVAGMNVFHGSPHKFEKFEMSKIGTGEGAQAYGHGLYFAENPQVAKSYQYAGQATYTNNQAAEKAYRALEVSNGDEVAAKAWLHKRGLEAPADQRQQYFDAMNNFDTFKNNKNLYRVDLPDEQIAKMLDWDKPLSQQPESVRKAIQSSAVYADRLAGHNAGKLKHPDEATGSMWMSFLKDEPSLRSAGTGKPMDVAGLLKFPASQANLKPTAEAFLASMGIPGIKYLDQGSRAGGKGTSNFVVFDETIPKIIGRE